MRHSAFKIALNGFHRQSGTTERHHFKIGVLIGPFVQSRGADDLRKVRKCFKADAQHIFLGPEPC